MLAAVITSKKFVLRSRLANCVALLAGQFGMVKSCVIQGETVTPIPLDQLDFLNGPVGKLDDATLRDVIKAIGFVMASDCEPV